MLTALTTEQQAVIALHGVEKRRLEEEIADLTAQVTRLQKDVKAGVSDRELLTADLTQTKRKVQDLEEDIKLKNGQIEELEKRLAESEDKMSLHVSLFEQVSNGVQHSAG